MFSTFCYGELRGETKHNTIDGFDPSGVENPWTNIPEINNIDENHIKSIGIDEM
jgi:hypothetical protein